LDATDVVVLPLVVVVVVKGPAPMLALLSNDWRLPIIKRKTFEDTIRSSNLKPPPTATFQHFKPQPKKDNDNKMLQLIAA